MKKIILLFIFAFLLLILITINASAEQLIIKEENSQIFLYDIKPSQEIISYLSNYDISHNPATGKITGDFETESVGEGNNARRVVVVYYDTDNQEKKITIESLRSQIHEHFSQQIDQDLISESDRLKDVLRKFSIIVIEKEIAEERGSSLRIIKPLGLAKAKNPSNLDIISGEIYINCAPDHEVNVGGILDYYRENWKIKICNSKITFKGRDKRTQIETRIISKIDNNKPSYITSYKKADSPSESLRYVTVGGTVRNRNRMSYLTRRIWGYEIVTEIISKIDGKYTLSEYDPEIGGYKDEGTYDNVVNIFTEKHGCIFPTEKNELGWEEHAMAKQEGGQEYFSLDNNPNLDCEIEPIGEGVAYTPLNKPSEEEVNDIVSLILDFLGGEDVDIPEYSRGTDIYTTSQNVLVRKRLTKEEVKQEIEVIV